MTILNANSQRELNLKLFCVEVLAYADGKLRAKGEKVIHMCVTKERLFKEHLAKLKNNSK